MLYWLKSGEVKTRQAIASALKMLQNSSYADTRFAVAETLQRYNLATY
jgi:hypothetical protein